MLFFSKKQNIQNRTQAGFTLVEIIISLGIFTVVAVIAIAALVKIVDANKKAQSIQSAVTNMNFALETISREMRVGTRYHCIKASDTFPVTGVSDSGDLAMYNSGYAGASNSCLMSATGGSKGVGIVFKSSQVAVDSSTGAACIGGGGGAYNLIYAYRFVPDGSGYRLQKAEQPQGCGTHLTASDFSDVISATNVTLTGYNLGVMYTPGNPGVAGAHQYPLATIRLIGFSGNAGRERGNTYFDIQTSASARIR